MDDSNLRTAKRAAKRRRAAGALTAGFLGVMASGLVALPALAQNIVVQGNTRTDAETIRSYLQLAPGESYTTARINQAVKDLFATGLFSDVKVNRSGNGVVVRVVENTMINRVSFEGNNKLKTDILQSEVQSRSRGPFSQALVDNDVQRLREIYRRSGRGEAQISARVVNGANGRVDVTYVIVEGSKTGVQAIEFVGNNAFSASRLRNVMETTESGLFGWLKSSDVYDPDRLAADVDRIRRYYLKNGYADFRVLSSSAEYDNAKKGYVITIAVEEGRQYRVAGVSVDSRVRDVDNASLQKAVRTSAGDVYNAEAVEKSVEAIASETAKRGYAFAQVRPRGERDPATQTVNIVYSVEEGPRVYVERINVRGNTRTRDYVIRREFDMGEGDAYNKVFVDRAERRLKALGFFKNVRVSSEPGSSPDRVIVNVDVEDQATGAFSVAGGYSTTDGFMAELSVQESNFLGRGQFVRASISNGERSRGYEFSFTEPFFLDRRLAAGFDLFQKQTFNSQYSRYETKTTGGTVRMALPFNDEFSIGVRYSLYQQRLTIRNTAAHPYNDCTYSLGEGITTLNGQNYCLLNGEASVAVKQAQGDTLTSLAGLTFAYNSLDNPKNPTSGILAELRPEIAGLGGDSKFFRVTADARYFYPIHDDITGILRVQGGHISGFGKVDNSSYSGNVRMIDHFFLGPTLVRGFAPGGIGPRDLNGDPSGNALGGTSYYGASAEAQFALPWVPRELGLRGAVFADAGTLFNYKGATAFDVNRNGVYDGFAGGCAATALSATGGQAECVNVRDKNVLRSSIGASILWQSPLGPIRFDYAYALTKDKGLLDPTTGAHLGRDRLQAFRFSGGTRF
ncbi:MAG: outer membrane protein assembly factor BamA [Proteobacteria bacterium]|nr:outer membrane protein assembly factor BamA [Pseudomonadota bacterium]